MRLVEEYNQLFDTGRVVCEGTTGFFRYEELLEIFADYALAQPPGSLKKFLFAPCSIGCEPLSFAMVAMHKGVFERHPDLQLYGLDISENFLRIAQKGYYMFGKGYINDEYTKYIKIVPETKDDVVEGRFITIDLRMFEFVDEIRSRVTFLPAQDILNHQPEDGLYDATMSLNLLLHLGQENDDAPRKEMFAHLASITNGLFCVNDAESIGRAEILKWRDERKIGFSSLHDFFNGKVIPLGVSSSDLDYQKVLGYYNQNRGYATMCLVSRPI